MIPIPIIPAVVRHRRKSLLSGGAPLLAAFSTFTVTPTVFDANGVAVADIDITAKDATNAAIAGLSGTMTAVPAAIDAAASTFVCLDPEVPNDGTTPANFLATLVDTDGFPVWGLPASQLSVASSRGATDTITEQDTETDHNGQFVITAVSVTPGTPVFTLTARGQVITQTASVEFTGTPALPTLDFFADWRTATGTGASAVGDGGKFNQIGGAGCEVIVNPGTLGFPATMANVLAVKLNQSNGGYTEPRKTSGLTAPAVGETRNYRIYFRLTSAAGDAVTDPEQHPIQDGSAAGQINWGWWIYQSTGGAGKWTLQWRPSATANAYPNDRWQLTTALDHDATYRFEWSIERTGATTFKAALRIYDDAGVLLFTGADFRNQTSATDLDTYMASNDFTFFNIANIVAINTGSNGLGGTDWTDGMTYSYQGGLATGIDCGWIGAYDLGNG